MFERHQCKKEKPHWLRCLLTCLNVVKSHTLRPTHFLKTGVLWVLGGLYWVAGVNGHVWFTPANIQSDPRKTDGWGSIPRPYSGSDCMAVGCKQAGIRPMWKDPLERMQLKKPSFPAAVFNDQDGGCAIIQDTANWHILPIGVFRGQEWECYIY